MHVSGALKSVFFAAFLMVTAITASAQMRDEASALGLIRPSSSDVGKPADAVVMGSTEEMVMGRVTDFAGRSVRSARITLFCLDTDDVHYASTNAFGFYKVKNLGEGHSYVVSIHHARYLFLTASISVTIAKEPIEIDFQAERIR